MQRILSIMRRACDQYKLIDDGDKIAVGISGGKDSLVLLKALSLYQRFSKQKFTLVAITIDMFDGKSDFGEISKFCESLGCEYHIVESEIYKIVFEGRQESSPCSLCAKMRRGMLNSKALELGCNKLALGHSADDVTHTFMLSLFFEGRLSSFLPKVYMDRTGLTVIRPLVLTEEKFIISQAKHLPVKKSNCPVDKLTKREYVKQLLIDLSADIPTIKEMIFSAISHPERYNLFDKAYGEYVTYNQRKNLTQNDRLDSLLDISKQSKNKD